MTLKALFISYTSYQIALFLFLLAIFLFKIPSFYIIPTVHNSLLTSQVLARLILVGIFLYFPIRNYLTQIESFADKKIRVTLIFILLLFSLQSLSILYTGNTLGFLTRYKDIVIGYMAFFIFYYFHREVKSIIAVLLLSALANSMYQILIVFAQDIFQSIGSFFIYEKQFELSIINFERGRVFSDSYDEFLIPILLLPHIKVYKRQLSLFLFSLISFLSFISNWRIRVLMATLALVGSGFFLLKKSANTIAGYVLLFFFTGILVTVFAQYTIGFSFLDRFLLQNKYRDVETLTFRVTQFQQGLEIGGSTPLGAGLGNYYDNLSTSEQTIFTSSVLQQREVRYVREYIHNIFFLMIAESGFWSLLVFLILLYVFVKNDLKILKGKTLEKKALVVSYWTLFVYSLFNPPVPGTYQILFWGLRGLLV